MEDLIGRSSESFTGSKEEGVVEEVEEVEAGSGATKTVVHRDRA
jgi:hypothetical protein